MFGKFFSTLALPFTHVVASIKPYLYLFKAALLVVIALFAAGLLATKTYQKWDNDPDRGAIAVQNSAFGDSYTTPVYLDQGWDESDSLWFYNTTQGSGLLSYDLFAVLEQEGSTEYSPATLLRSVESIDKFRYLPQKATFFNPDGLPVGFTKDEYQGHDYIGFTCAACHTSQVNYQGTAIRIDGGPAMSDMVGFLTALEKSLLATQQDDAKLQRFIENVIGLGNDYDNADEVLEGLAKAIGNIQLYNTVNYSNLDYGYARLDAFGRIYNRVLQHVLNRAQVENLLALTVGPTGDRILNETQIANVMENIDKTLVDDKQFALILQRLQSSESGYPGLGLRDILRVRNQIFNTPNAPVSYPFLWDIVQSTYVQWNGLADNSGPGPIGRNAGEVIGVFGILDWEVEEGGFSLAGYLSGQASKSKRIDFKSSVNITNLQRLESHLRVLQSPQWPEEILGEIDEGKAKSGELIYDRYCVSCHEIVERDNWDRIVISNMLAVESVKTDGAMAENSVNYTGKSGNFAGTYQTTNVGPVVIQEQAPVVQILTSATTGVIATPDADKMFLRRWIERIYTLAMAIGDNPIKESVKAGDYNPDTTSNPYASLKAYKARSLNGIWATAPYLHNGSVPTLYDLLLPEDFRTDTDGATKPEDGQIRPSSFMVGSREFDPEKVGFVSRGYDGFEFNTEVSRGSQLPRGWGNSNNGHEYAAGVTPPSGADAALEPLNEEQRWQLVEFLKTL